MSSHYPHPILAREGWPFVFGTLLVALLLTLYAGVWALPFWLCAVFVIQFFRDPPRRIPAEPDVVVSPADGRIVTVGPAMDPYRQRAALKISVFMNVFNVHSNRCPLDATVQDVRYHRGRFVNAALAKASDENERNALLLTTPDGTEVTVVQIAGLIARRILCYTRPGERLQRGQRYGFIRFGSRVDVYLPPHALPRVALGDKVLATETILASLAPPEYPATVEASSSHA